MLKRTPNKILGVQIPISEVYFRKLYIGKMFYTHTHTHTHVCECVCVCACKLLEENTEEYFCSHGVGKHLLERAQKALPIK